MGTPFFYWLFYVFTFQMLFPFTPLVSHSLLLGGVLSLPQESPLFMSFYFKDPIHFIKDSYKIIGKGMGILPVERPHH